MAVAAEAAPAKEAEELPLPSFETLDYGAGLREVSIVSAIEEYLAYHQLDRPLEAFRRDCDRAELRHKSSRASAALQQGVENVLVDFDAGRRERFAAGWERAMPEDFRLGREGRALELRLQAYFATFRARKALQSGGEPDALQLQVDLEPFRLFLTSHGLDEVCGEEALMPLFALPFVQRPYAQPHIAAVFKAKWQQELRRDVDAALRSRHPQLPLLYELLEPSPGAEGQADGTAWRRVWAELVRVADFGLDAATMLACGVPVSGELLQRARQLLQRLREQVPGGLELRLHSELPIVGPGVMSPARSVRSRAATAPPEMPRDLDFGKLAQHIRSGASERDRLFAGVGTSLAAVLRALLQRLASAEAPLSHRRGFLVAVACFDVLGVRARPQTLPQLLSDPSLAELTLGILAVLACEASGRSYIVENLACVESVVEILKSQPLDSSMHIQALAAMQRLSLRRKPQDRMIELGLVDWVIGVLGWQGEAIQGMPSEFSLEFGSAMLMNLALRSAGRQKCAELDALTVSLNLMEHWNPQIRTHINGTLYSLLSVPSFRAQARRAGLEQILKSIHAQAASLGDEISRRQIEYLLEQLSPPHSEAPAAADGAESGEDDDDDDENFLEEEELAGLLLGDRGGRCAEEALAGFRLAAAPPSVAEA